MVVWIISFRKVTQAVGKFRSSKEPKILAAAVLLVGCTARPRGMDVSSEWRLVVGVVMLWYLWSPNPNIYCPVDLLGFLPKSPLSMRFGFCRFLRHIQIHVCKVERFGHVCMQFTACSLNFYPLNALTRAMDLSRCVFLDFLCSGWFKWK